jgi:tetratricopeptide (TPR) repeat protein
MLVLGCEPASTPQTVVTAPVQVQDPKEQSASVADSKEPQSVALHPIDELPEGKRYRTGTKALDANDLTKVREIADELLQSKDYAPLGQALEGFLLVRSGKLDEAMSLAERLSEIPVLQAECYLIAGEVFTKRLQYLAALDAFTNAAKKDPSNVRAHRWLAVVYHDTGAMNKATEHLRIVASLDPTDLRSLRFAGMIHREYEKFEDSVTDYQNALKRNPPAKVADEIRLELAESLLKLRQLEEVQQTLAAVVSKSASRSSLLAESLETAGQVDEAMAAAKEALEMDSNHLRSRLVLGRLYNGNRQWDQSIECLQPVVAQYPAEHEPMFLLGRALISSGKEDEGKKWLTESKKFKDTFLKFSELNAAAVNRPQDAALRIEIGKLAEELQKVGIARTWYLAALGLDPSNVEAKEALTRLSRYSKINK